MLLLLLFAGGAACAASPATADAGSEDDRAATVATGKPRWAVEGRDWPYREASRFIELDGLRWHYQRMGEGPVLLLLHGTGAATHSWYPMATELAEHFTVVMVDLPGHGFTSTPEAAERFSLPSMASDLERLLAALDLDPEWVVGHSAGAAILVRMALDGAIEPRALISLNGALLQRRGFAFYLFAPIVRILVQTDTAARLFARRAAKPGVVEKTLARTGSELSSEQLARYRRLFQTPGHTGAALHMMAHWRLEEMEPELADLALPLVLIVGDQDGFVDPQEAYEVKGLAPQAEVVELAGLGHLAHEEAPARVLQQIMAAVERYSKAE